MTIFFWIVDMIIPFAIIVLGIRFKYYHPKKINNTYGYRTTRSMKSQSTWDYANRRFGEHCIRVGIFLFIFICLNKLFTPISKEYLSLIHAGIGVISLIIVILIIETELKVKFDKCGNSKKALAENIDLHVKKK